MAHSSRSNSGNNKTKNKKELMKIQRNDTASRWAISLLAGCLIASCGAANAQNYEDVTTKSVGRAGVLTRGVLMVLNGQAIGSALPKACDPTLLKAGDTNQDGMASASELNAALLNRFQQADTDSNGALSETELAAALKSLFPAPQPPPGAPPPPEEMALHNLLAKKLMVTVDTNKDGWMTFQEALSFVSQA